jgi:hypothetical protein
MSTGALFAGALVLIVVLVAVVAYEAHVYQRNKVFKATAVQLVTPPGPRWWQRLLDRFLTAVIVLALIAAVLRFMPRGSRPVDPSPEPSATSPAAPGASSADQSTTSHPRSSTPNGVSR